MAYARPFPASRTERVAPGQLVAVATAADGSDVVIWRWFDAVVLEGVDGAIRLWEPAHGTVLARPAILPATLTGEGSVCETKSTQRGDVLAGQPPIGRTRWQLSWPGDRDVGEEALRDVSSFATLIYRSICRSHVEHQPQQASHAGGGCNQEGPCRAGRRCD